MQFIWTTSTIIQCWLAVDGVTSWHQIYAVEVPAWGGIIYALDKSHEWNDETMLELWNHAG